MKKCHVLLFLCATMLVVATDCWSQDNTEVDAGVLLGLRNDSAVPSTYRTLWITTDSGKVNVRQGTGIWLSYDDDFWQIDSKWYEKETYNDSGNAQFQIEYLLARPADQVIAVDEMIRNYVKSFSPDWIVVSESAKLVFVGNQYACIQQDGEYDSGGASRPGESDIFVREIKDINRSFIRSEAGEYGEVRKNIPLQKFFGAAVTPYLNEHRSMEITEAEQDLYGSDPTVQNQTDEWSWGLKRKSARWRPQIAKKWHFTNATTSFDSYDLYDLPLTVPKTLITYNNSACNFHLLKKAIPEAFDAAVSPNRDLWVVFTPGRLMIYTDKELKEPLSLILSGKESLIMTEWALGKYAAKWNSELAIYLK